MRWEISIDKSKQHKPHTAELSSVQFSVYMVQRRKRERCVSSPASPFWISVLLWSLLSHCDFLRFVKCQWNTSEIIGDFVSSSPDGWCSANSPANRPTLDWRDSKGQRAWPITSSPSCSREDIWPDRGEKKNPYTHWANLRTLEIQQKDILKKAQSFLVDLDPTDVRCLGKKTWGCVNDRTYIFGWIVSLILSITIQNL